MDGGGEGSGFKGIPDLGDQCSKRRHLSLRTDLVDRTCHVLSQLSRSDVYSGGAVATKDKDLFNFHPTRSAS